jgi:molybdate transport system substrate-binding protein
MYKLIVFSMVAVLTTLTQWGVTNAAEIKVLGTTSWKFVFEELTPQFERETGHKIALAPVDTGARVTKRILGGETADVVIISGAGMEVLTKQGKVVPESRVKIARASIGVAVRKGAPKPDISTPEALKRTLLAAKSVAYSDPASGAASGVHFVKVLERLGIAEEVKAKAKLIPTGTGIVVGDIVARGDAEIGVQQLSELAAVSGVDVVGPLPGALQSVTPSVAGIMVNAKQPEAGKALIKFLTTPAAVSVIKAKGLEPPPK